MLARSIASMYGQKGNIVNEDDIEHEEGSINLFLSDTFQIAENKFLGAYDCYYPKSVLEEKFEIKMTFESI